jgi:NAD(P)H-flavin reductase
VTRLRYRGREVALEDGETVLECLERAGFEPRASCRGGACQACLLRASEGAVSGKAQAGLKASWRAQGYFLACQLTPTEDLELLDPEDAAAEVDAALVASEPLGGEVWRLRVQAAAGLDVRPGQFVHVARPADGVSRPYSVASAAGEPLELHVRRIEGGELSPWLTDLEPGAPLRLRGPFGDCTYEPGQPDQRLILAGTTTGLAPLLGVARDALASGHGGDIVLYHGSTRPAGLYLGDELAALAAAHPNLEVRRCALDAEGAVDVHEGALDALVLEEQPEPAGARVFLCGDPGFVNGLKRKLFLAGAALKEIHSDPFLPVGKPDK